MLPSSSEAKTPRVIVRYETPRKVIVSCLLMGGVAGAGFSYAYGWRGSLAFIGGLVMGNVLRFWDDILFRRWKKHHLHELGDAVQDHMTRANAFYQRRSS